MMDEIAQVIKFCFYEKLQNLMDHNAAKVLCENDKGKCSGNALCAVIDGEEVCFCPLGFHLLTSGGTECIGKHMCLIHTCRIENNSLQIWMSVYLTVCLVSKFVTILRVPLNVHV